MHDFRKRRIICLSIIGTAALVLPLWVTNYSTRDSVAAFPELEDIEDAEFRRFLMEQTADQSYEMMEIPEWLLGDTSGEEYTKNLEAAMAAAIDDSKRSSGPKTIAPYDLAELENARSLFSNTLGVVVYDPAEDDFLFFYSKNTIWASACTKLSSAFDGFTIMARETFPERFQGPGSEEFAIAISSGDYPHISPHCTNFPHVSDKCSGSHAPILAFGSVFQSAEIFPNMMAMPMPTGEHIHCFKNFAQSKSVCLQMQVKEGPDGPKGAQVFGEEFGLKWEDLIPQVVWRGTDFNYLNLLIPDLRRARINGDLVKELESTEEANKKAVLIKGMREIYDNMYPRWQSVILTAESEVEAAEKGTLPWANMKFTGPAGMMKKEAQQYDLFAKYGIDSIGESIGRAELAKYKYHIDLGGGGGTTWTGTIQKLAMPGLLFHHMTPTKDYILDVMKPWIHFIPVASHLGDLKEKVAWAESHPQAAKMIADQGSAMMRGWSTTEGYGEMFDAVFKQPFQMALDAYQPVSSAHPGLSWKDVMEKEYSHMVKVKACVGRKNNSRGSGGGCRHYASKINKRMTPFPLKKK
mmetsp:Transcript_22893/g.41071  ORF Transcript_22893/g.41071 Transcript_22893/m.41071 type:complete len:579 (-) Transcript_22893:199-1935(-)